MCQRTDYVCYYCITITENKLFDSPSVTKGLNLQKQGLPLNNYICNS